MEGTLRTLQQSLLSIILRIMLLIAVPLMIAVSLEELRGGHFYRVLIIYLPLFAILAATAFGEWLPFRLRTVSLITILYAVGVSEFFYFGFSSQGFLYFYAAVISASLLSDPGTGFRWFCIELATVAGLALAYRNGLVPIASDNQIGAGIFINWISPTLSFTTVAAGTVVIQNIIFRHLDRSMQNERTVRGELEQEKESLSRANRELENIAFIDPVTGLPNNKRLIKDIAVLMAENEGRDYSVRLILVELSRFEEINIRHGLDAGNRFLLSMATRLTALPDATVYRMTGAKFLVSSIDPAPSLSDTIETRLLEMLTEPVGIDAEAVRIDYRAASIRYPEDQLNPTLLVSDLMLILNSASHTEQNSLIRYTDVRSRQLKRTGQIVDQLENALKRGEIYVCVQPRIDLASGEITGGELLLRWDNSLLGPLSPAEFIPIAERETHIYDLTRFTTEAGIGFLNSLKSFGADIDSFTLSINISPMIIQSRRIDQYISAVVDAGYSDAFEFELTEGVFIGLNRIVEEEIEAIHRAGISISIDDFGTGYSNLEYLQGMNPDILKIDKKFISGIPHNARQTKLVSAIINMGQALKIRTVAEGVEYMEQFRWLQAQGVNEIQGFLIAKPMQFDYFRSFLTEHDPTLWRISG